MRRFTNRADAGRRLGAILAAELELPLAGIVLGLPRGGVPVAAEIADRLEMPLDVFVVRKLGVPGHEEYAMGAIASGGIRVLNVDAVRRLGISDAAVDAVTRREQQELERREVAYRGDDRPPDLEGTHVILVDDGMATGSTMQAAIEAVRSSQPASITVAVPVAPPETVAAMRPTVERMVVAATPDPFFAVGAWYDDFTQTSDGEVRRLIQGHR